MARKNSRWSCREFRVDKNNKGYTFESKSLQLYKYNKNGKFFAIVQSWNKNLFPYWEIKFLISDTRSEIQFWTQLPKNWRKQCTIVTWTIHRNTWRFSIKFSSVLHTDAFEKGKCGFLSLKKKRRGGIGDARLSRRGSGEALDTTPLRHDAKHSDADVQVEPYPKERRTTRTTIIHPTIPSTPSSRGVHPIFHISICPDSSPGAKQWDAITGKAAFFSFLFFCCCFCFFLLDPFFRARRGDKSRDGKKGQTFHYEK